MTGLPDILSSNDFPEAELCALRLDGELYRLGECFRPVDLPADKFGRALAVARAGHPKLVADRLTAAWIHGVVDEAPYPAQFCVDTRVRAHNTVLLRFGARQVILGSSEIELLGSQQVTSAMRTAVDIAHCSTDFGTVERELIRSLAQHGDFTLADCADVLEAGPKWSGRRATARRLASLAA